MTGSIYKKLREQMDQYSIGFPETESGIEIKILKKLFTEEEAAMYLDLSRRFNLSMRRTLFVLTTSFLATTTLATFMGTGLPVLPVMALLFIAAHYDRIRIIDPREKREAMIGAAIVTGILVAATFLLKLVGY